MNPHIRQVNLALEKENLDGLILSHAPNISYLTEFSSSDAYLLVSPKDNFYFTDSRYTEEAKLNLHGFTISKINGSFAQTIASVCKKINLRRIGFEERHLPYAEFKVIKEKLGQGFDFVPSNSIVEKLRQIKTKEEIGKIKKAIEITQAAVNFIQEFLKPGRTELEIAGELERFIRYQGASFAFEIIIAGGPNSSYPHHLIQARKLRNNEAVLIDLGVDFAGYKSDLTRVFFLGKINFLWKKIHRIVKEAQLKAIKAVKPGCLVRQVDSIARQHIVKKGYSAFFGHNLGHGIGLEVHEAPYICGKEEISLKEGMVFTLEPGIYLPGKFGVRIEDIVLVTKRGAQVLSGAFH